VEAFLIGKEVVSHKKVKRPPNKLGKFFSGVLPGTATDNVWIWGSENLHHVTDHIWDRPRVSV
jgi:hypothetical protein